MPSYFSRGFQLSEGGMLKAPTADGSAGAIMHTDGSGQLAFADGMFWDSVNDRLGIGTTSPQSKVHIFPSGSVVTIGNSSASDVFLALKTSGGSQWNLRSQPSNFGIDQEGIGRKLTIITANGNVLIGTSSDEGSAAFQVFGAMMQTASSTASVRAQGKSTASWVDSTDATRKARVIYSVYDTAAREAWRAEASGSAPMIGFLGASAVLRQVLGDAATDAPSTQTLANNIRTALINLGLGSAA